MSNRIGDHAVVSGTRLILEEVCAERVRQDEKWGEQNHPSVGPVLAARIPFDPDRVCVEYEIPGESRAKYMCQTAAARGECTYAHIALEEFAEAISCPDDATRREELVQLAAVVVQWIEAIDRRVAKGGG